MITVVGSGSNRIFGTVNVIEVINENLRESFQVFDDLKWRYSYFVANRSHPKARGTGRTSRGGSLNTLVAPWDIQRVEPDESLQ